MGVERGQHALDGGADQFGLVGCFDIFVADAVKHLAKEFELAIKFAHRFLGCSDWAKLGCGRQTW